MKKLPEGSLLEHALASSLETSRTLSAWEVYAEVLPPVSARDLVASKID